MRVKSSRLVDVGRSRQDMTLVKTKPLLNSSLFFFFSLWCHQKRNPPGSCVVVLASDEAYVLLLMKISYLQANTHIHQHRLVSKTTFRPLSSQNLIKAGATQLETSSLKQHDAGECVVCACWLLCPSYNHHWNSLYLVSIIRFLTIWWLKANAKKSSRETKNWG